MGTDGDAADDDDALEGGRYQGVRDLFRQARAGGFDEDPPARIDALLMAAARQHAPAPKAGALERFRRWMVASLMQPAVAGAVAVAVIGGAAGVLYMKGKPGISEPTAGAEQHAAAPQEPAPSPDDLPAAIETPPTPGISLGSAERTSDSAELKARLREQLAREEDQRRAPERVERPKGTGTARGGDRGSAAAGPGGGGDVAVNDAFGGEMSFDDKPDGRDTTKSITPETEGAARGGGGTAGSGNTITGGVTTQIARPDPPRPDGSVFSDEELESPNVSGTPETTGSGRTATPSNRTQAENLLRQARTAAKKKDCPTVRIMAKRARQLDADYYTSTFSRDAAVKPCL